MAGSGTREEVQPSFVGEKRQMLGRERPVLLEQAFSPALPVKLR